MNELTTLEDVHDSLVKITAGIMQETLIKITESFENQSEVNRDFLVGIYDELMKFGNLIETLEKLNKIIIDKENTYF